eukprot:UN34413
MAPILLIFFFCVYYMYFHYDKNNDEKNRTRKTLHHSPARSDINNYSKIKQERIIKKSSRDREHEQSDKDLSEEVLEPVELLYGEKREPEYHRRSKRQQKTKYRNSKKENGRRSSRKYDRYSSGDGNFMKRHSMADMPVDAYGRRKHHLADVRRVAHSYHAAYRPGVHQNRRDRSGYLQEQDSEEENSEDRTNMIHDDNIIHDAARPPTPNSADFYDNNPENNTTPRGEGEPNHKNDVEMSNIR